MGMTMNFFRRVFYRQTVLATLTALLPNIKNMRWVSFLEQWLGKKPQKDSFPISPQQTSFTPNNVIQNVFQQYHNRDCYLDDPNTYQPPGDKISVNHMRPHGTGCVPCLLKMLVQQYWGPYRMSRNGNGRPQIFETNDPAIVGLHKLADRWFCREPETSYRHG